MGNGNNMGSGGGDDDFGEPASMFMRSNVGLGVMNIVQQNTPPSYDYYHPQDSTQFSLKPISGSENGGLNVGSGKVLFTETQWQELERQTIIYKYIMASRPVPHHLLLPLSTHFNSGMDMRFASGSDPELWRCRRTDGKKWRCSRDVAPDQKYCEHHVHKSRPRSRKPVEIQSQNTNVTTSALNITPTIYANTLSATSSYQHPRGTEWLMKSGTLPMSSSANQQLQQQSMDSHSPRVGSKRTHIFRQDSEGNLQNDSHIHYNNSSVASDASVGARRQSFIDAWSRSGGGDDCSLTLSMQCSSGIDNDDDQSYEGGVGLLDLDRGDGLKSHNMWLNQGSWMSSPPGGPLGEALGLGIASSAKGTMDMPSRHSHSDNDDSHGRELR
uniref:growth-regulating factor 8-like n=1 Tax=Erigeron canadensis TaxID=72917 RepID=UPI001CB93C1E|nr:growth-regulating factor 8-like [Erigeron canadensis]